MNKSIVAYFSASGTTAEVAKRLAAIIHADEFEIKPEKPYSDADLRWTNPLARCNREKFGKKDVPIADKIGNINEYDTIFIGFPIWYYGAPNIINTFVKSYDLSGKKILLFATSGGSDIGKTAAKLKPYLSDGAEITDAKVFPPSVSIGELKAWAEIYL